MSESNKRAQSKHGQANLLAPRKAGARVKTRAVHKAKTPSSPAKRNNTKLAVIITMLRRPKGATVDEIAKSIGWKQHSVRGIFAGALKKRLGLTLTSEKTESGRIYRITGGGAA
jgi:Protein of unknown function (DUF3489)